MFASGEQANFEGFTHGTLLRLNHQVGKGKLTKHLLGEVLGHFGLVSYVDVATKGQKQQVTIRFASLSHTEDFLAKASDFDPSQTSLLEQGNAEFVAKSAL